MTQAAEPRRSGRLWRDERALPVVASCASRLSLRVELEGGPVANGVVFDAIDVDLAHGTTRLGRCRFTLEGGIARGTTGNLVFLDDVYDCRALVHEGKLIDLRGFFQNVPLVMAQRDQIRPEFREYCANLVYDISVYKRFFDEQDRVIAEEPDHVAHTTREALLRTEGRRFMDLLDEKISELNALVAGFTPEEHERHGFYLRRMLWPYLMAGEFLKRSNLKPRGYSGDAEMMLMAYQNSFVGTYVFNQLMHKHGVETRAAEAVRSRRRLIPTVLKEVVERFRGLPPHGFRFLSLACGPASELEDIFQGAEDAARLDVTLLDQDPFALDLARETIRRIEAACGARVSAHYIEDSVRTVIRARDLSRVLGKHHFVYSMGLFDYLTTPVARAVLARAWQVVNPGGTLLVGNFHVANPTRYHMAYWGDWSLCYRTEESFLALTDGLEDATATLEFDDTRCQMFLRLQRKA